MVEPAKSLLDRMDSAGVFQTYLLLAALLLTAGCHSPSPERPSAPAAAPIIAQIKFVDVADQAGLRYRWTIPGKRPMNLLQTIGNGCALLDVDNDGNLDVLLVGPHVALFKGDGHGKFTDASHAYGLDLLQGDFRGCAVADYDNDGFEDVYLYGYRCAALLHNDHGRRFVDVTRAMGLSTRPWGAAAAFADIDGDGKLDLYVGDYVQFGPKSLQYCPINHVDTACGPQKYPAEHGTLYRNTGTRFVDVTHAWGADCDAGKILGVAFADYDDSGRESLATANDEAPGSLLHNLGGRFRDEGVATGVAFDQNGNVHGGMGIDWGDYDNDGRLDLLVATYQQEVKSLYHNGGALFTDNAIPLGLAMKASPYVAFGAKFIDADNDGWLDILFTNGHTEDNTARVTPGTSFRQPTLLFHNRLGTAFDDLPGALSGPAGRPIVGRGLAIGDFDNDGRMDALVVDSDGAPLLLHNETTGAGHWLLCQLVGRRCNHDGIGALLKFHAGNRTLLRRCGTDGSYLSASDRRVHVGLGAAARADIEIRWPDGHVDQFRDVRADRVVTLEEGAVAVRTGIP